MKTELVDALERLNHELNIVTTCKELLAVTAEIRATLDKYADALAAEDGGLVLAQDHETRQRGAMITPCQNSESEWRVTWFDPHGFGGHTVRPSKPAAIRLALAEGFRDVDRNRLRRLSQLPCFHEGNRRSEIVERENAGRLGQRLYRPCAAAA